MYPKFDVGDLVEYAYDLLFQDLVGIVTYRYMYTGNMWYKVLWSTGKSQDIAEVELKKIKTDK
jgi:hypothetical protein